MSDNRTSFCTDEELLRELKKLGHSDVTDEVFDMMKKDLSELLLKEVILSLTPPRKEENTSTNSMRTITDLQKKCESEKKIFSHQYINSDLSEHEYRDQLKSSETPFLQKKYASLNQIDTSNSRESSSDDSFNGVESIVRYQDIIKHKFCESQSSDNDYNSSSCSGSSEENKIKRKVLRHKNGKAIITEEFLDLPKMFSSSYPESELQMSNSISSEEFSIESKNSNKNSNVSDSKSTASSFRSVPLHLPNSFDTKSVCSIQSRRVNNPRKKSDPVTMYNYYKTFWDNFKPPGEKTHNKLRWTMRDKMLDYHL